MHIDTGRLAAAAGARAGFLADKDREFMERVYAGDHGRYLRRIAQYGFCGLSRVLDAGAGVGQWSLALAQRNAEVTALEFDESRCRFLSSILTDLDLSAIRVERGDVTALPHADGTFDGVFCYGVIEQTPWRDTLREFRRVLAPGGRLYVNANDIGWYRFLWDTEHNRSETYDPKMFAARALLNAVIYERGGEINFPAPMLIGEEELLDGLRAAGFAVVAHGPEGTVVCQGYAGAVEPPFFVGAYRGDPGVHEAVAVSS